MKQCFIYEIGLFFGPEDRGSIPGRGIDKISSLHHLVQTCSGTDRAS